MHDFFLCSKRQFIWALPDSYLWVSFWNFRRSYFKFSHALVHVSYLKGTMIVSLHEISQLIREALPAPLAEVRQDVLYEAVSILLLVRQQLQRSNQTDSCKSPEELHAL